MRVQGIWRFPVKSMGGERLTGGDVDERGLEFDGIVSIGSCTLAVRKPIHRCIMVTRPQPAIEHDLGVLKTIIHERDNQLGIGATVTSPGRIEIGDELIPG